MKVEIQQDTLNKVLSKVEGFQGITGRMADKVLAETGAEGRKGIGESHESGLRFGRKIKKWKNTKTLGTGYVTDVFSRMDQKHGWYKSRNTNLNDGRLIGFSFDSAARRKVIPVSKGHAYSLIANLWAQPSKAYRTNSPYFYSAGYKRGRWKAGESRPKKVSFDASLIQARMATILTNSEKKIGQMIKEQGL